MRFKTFDLSVGKARQYFTNSVMTASLTSVPILYSMLIVTFETVRAVRACQHEYTHMGHCIVFEEWRLLGCYAVWLL
jgi:hypothetical protein